MPLKAPVAGIAMGLVSDEVDGATREYVALTDILGAEDAFGDMDFKVAGTKEFVTALQLDTKLDGIPSEVLAAALPQARDARLTILDVMAEAIDAPDEMSQYAPRITTIKVPVDKIGEVIGPKGKMINSITEETGADIAIEDDGTIYVGAADGPSAQAAVDMINAIANPQLPKVGERFLGTVVKTAAFGAFVSLLPGKDGLVHISKLGNGKRIGKVEDVVKVGDKLQVEIADIDDRGKISLVPVFEEAAAGAAAAPEASTGATRRRCQPARSPAEPTRVDERTRSAGVDRSVLPGGLRVVTESVPGARSASVGVWVGVGSVDETADLAGAAHYLEHLLFKGTERRTRRAARRRVDAVGGELNAFTAKEHTCYYAHVLADDLPLAVDLVCDVVLAATLAAADVETERARGARGDRHARRRPRGPARRRCSTRRCSAATRSAGRCSAPEESIRTLHRDALHGFWRAALPPARMVVAAAGNVAARAGRRARELRRSRADGAAAGVRRVRRAAVPAAARLRCRPSDIEQAHMMLGVPTAGRQRPAAVRARRAEHRARRRDELAAVPARSASSAGSPTRSTRPPPATPTLGSLVGLRRLPAGAPRRGGRRSCSRCWPRSPRPG